MYNFFKIKSFFFLYGKYPTHAPTRTAHTAQVRNQQRNNRGLILGRL